MWTFRSCTRPYHSQINFASGPCLNIPVYAVLLHMDTPPANNRLCFLLLLTIYAGVSLLHSILFFSHIKVARNTVYHDRRRITLDQWSHIIDKLLGHISGRSLVIHSLGTIFSPFAIL